MEFQQANNWEETLGPTQIGNRQSPIFRNRSAERMRNWSILERWIHSGCKASTVTRPKIHSQASVFELIPEPNANGRFDLWGQACGIAEGLAKEVEVQCGVTEVRKERGGRPGAQGSGGFSRQCGPIRFRSTGATHLGNLA